MTYRVAIFGHSQLPRNFPNIPGIETRVYRKPGAKLARVYDYPEFSEVFTWEHHHNIIFLGGNDIGLGPDAPKPSVIVAQLIALCERLRDAGQTVSLCQIEPRRYLSDAYAEIYTQSQERINRRLKRYIRSRRDIYRLIHFNSRSFSDNHTIDGVHFNSLASEHIKDKMVHALMYFREEHEARARE